MPSFTRLLTGAVAATGIYLSAHALYLRAHEQWLLPASPVIRAKQLATEERWAEAKLIADFVIAHPRLGDVQAAESLSRQAQLELDSFWGASRRFTRGALSGEPVDTASMLGSLSLDLFVIGDIRDLAVQGWKELRHGSGDELIMALSAVGVATTFTPQLDWAPALLKALKRSNALSKRFLVSLRATGRRALYTRDFMPLKKVADDMGSAAKALGPGPLRGSLQHVETAHELERLAGAAEVDAKATYSVIALFGRRGLTGLARNGANILPIAASIKVAARLTKLISKWTVFLPLAWLVAIFALSGLVLALCVKRTSQTAPGTIALERGHPTCDHNR